MDFIECFTEILFFNSYFVDYKYEEKLLKEVDLVLSYKKIGIIKNLLIDLNESCLINLSKLVVGNRRYQFKLEIILFFNFNHFIFRNITTLL